MILSKEKLTGGIGAWLVVTPCFSTATIPWDGRGNSTTVESTILRESFRPGSGGHFFLLGSWTRSRMRLVDEGVVADPDEIRDIDFRLRRSRTLRRSPAPLAGSIVTAVQNLCRGPSLRCGIGPQYGCVAKASPAPSPVIRSE